jgi:predicted glycosyltransferase
MFRSPQTLPARGGHVRVQFHSHDSFGLGHLRRTLTLAGAVRTHLPQAEILVTTGSPCATHFTVPTGVEVLKLPSVSKDDSGNYIPRALGSDIEMLVALRRGILSQVQRTFAPHVLVVDHQILGLGEELAEVLEATREAGTRTVLGVRDIIDSPDAVARDWGRPMARRALREWYDRVCVYGDPRIFDARDEYPVPPELRDRLEYVGYVGREAVPARVQRESGERPMVLVTTGGGEDGYERISTYLDALELGDSTWDSTIICGPLLDEDHFKSLKRRVRRLPGVQIHMFHSDLPHLLSRADAVVAMSGYNTSVEILQSRVPSVLVPRYFPRREQLIRAERLDRAGLATCLPTPDAVGLRRAVQAALARGQIEAPLPSMNGAQRLARVVAEQAEASRTPQRVRAFAP